MATNPAPAPALTPQQIVSRKETIKSLLHRASRYEAAEPTRAKACTDEAEAVIKTLPPAEAAALLKSLEPAPAPATATEPAPAPAPAEHSPAA